MFLTSWFVIPHFPTTFSSPLHFAVNLPFISAVYLCVLLSNNVYSEYYSLFVLFFLVTGTYRPTGPFLPRSASPSQSTAARSTPITLPVVNSQCLGHTHIFSLFLPRISTPNRARVFSSTPNCLLSALPINLPSLIHLTVAHHPRREDPFSARH